MLRAYSVTTDWSEGGVIVFAASVALAKTEALTSDRFEDEEWIDLRAKREPTIDSEAECYGPGFLDFSAPEQCALARNLGWYELENSETPCKRCNRYPWRLVDGSEVDAETELCGDCVCE